jgi:hypothetical protein
VTIKKNPQASAIGDGALPFATCWEKRARVAGFAVGTASEKRKS